MTRYFIHFVVWILGVPWLACSVWYWWIGFTGSPDIGFQAFSVSLFIAGLGGLYGVLVCLVITFPLSVIACLLFGLAPRFSRRLSIQIGFPVVTSLIGLLWAQTTATSLGTGRREYALLAVGLLAGLTLGLLTIRLWAAPARNMRTQDATNDPDLIPPIG